MCILVMGRFFILSFCVKILSKSVWIECCEWVIINRGEIGMNRAIEHRTSNVEHRTLILAVFTAVLLPLVACAALGPAGQRRVVSLDGQWEIAEGGMEQVPAKFGHKVPVPGLADMAEPKFEEVGVKSEKREAFWYRRTFTLKSAVPEHALLKVFKAKFGTRVYLNGQMVGEHNPCFTPGYFDVKKYLKPAGKENELIIRIGASQHVLPKIHHWGADVEKKKYFPGIYDSVDLILAGLPFIKNVQVVPEIEKHTARVVVKVQGGRDTKVDYKVREAQSGDVVVEGSVPMGKVEEAGMVVFDFRVLLRNCRLWSPEDPFLYELELTTAGDGIKERFGMRSFKFDAENRRAVLNGKPYYMRGSNVTIYRFFEDSERDGLPWDKTWVRDLHRKFKHMHWNSLRYCIGFPPEFWYDIADEEGILIQDEFPIWYAGPKARRLWPPECKTEHMIVEYKEWMRERWNHPCVVIWDAQNETLKTSKGKRRNETAETLTAVRHLDLSNRPWENGFGGPQAPGDCQEIHPYKFPKYRPGKGEPPAAGPLSDILTSPDSGIERLARNHAMIVNEYGYLWIHRDGTPTRLTHGVWESCFPDADTAEARRYHYARWLAMLTEYFRGHRQCAGVLHFCGLGYSRAEEPRGETSDHFLDLAKLELEAKFEEFVRDSFSPVGLIINYWNSYVTGGVDEKVDVYVINDLGDGWKGDVNFHVEKDGKILQKQSTACTVAGYGREILSFDLRIPAEKGLYKIIAEIEVGGETVTSFRDVEVK